MLNWSGELSAKNYCGWCTGYGSHCNGECFKEGSNNYKEHREDHIKEELIRAKKRLVNLLFNENDWNHIHDTVEEAIGLSLKPEGLEAIFHQLPEVIQYDAFKYRLSDTEVNEKIFKFLKNNEISVK